MQLITLQSEQIKVTISSKGAEIQSIRDANGIERMYNGDPKFWASRAPILFPVAGGMKDDGYEWQGQWYPMPKHGFIRFLEWQVEDVKKNQVTFLLQEKNEGFPFEYDLRAVFTVEGNKLDVNYAVTSRDERPFCFSIGSHEAYAIPGGIETYEVVFDEEETLAHSLLEGALNTHDTVIVKDHAKVLPLKYEYFAVDALVFRSLKSRGVTLRSTEHNRTIRVDYPDCPFLLLWTKPGAPYICIEPWCNGPDFVDAPKEIDRKPGFTRVEKGQTVSKRHVITIA